MNKDQAWQSVLGQLQLEMPRASFDTWVRDTKAVSFQDAVMTVSVRNSYARDWLENRLTSTINRLLIGILNAGEVSVKFVVNNGEDNGGYTENYDGPRSVIFADALEDKKSDPDNSVEISLVDYDSVYEQVVRPNRAVYLPGYFRRWLRALGPDLGWLYVAFRQAAYIAGSRTGKAANRIPGERIASLAGCAERTYWRRVENKTTWQKLKGLVEISDHGPEWDASSSMPKRLPRRYTISMTLPLTPTDAKSLGSWLSEHVVQHGGPEGVLRAAIEAPLDELIPLNATEPGDPVTVTRLVRDLFRGGDLSNELLDSLASAIQNRIMPQNDLIVVTEYFLRHVLPHLGAGPGWMLTLLRDMCYVNTENGEVRNRVTVKGGYAEIAGWMGMSRPKTIWEWLNEKYPESHDAAGKYKNSVLRVYTGEVFKEATVLDFGGQPRIFDVLIEEIPRELLEAVLTKPNGAIDSIGMARLSEANGATVSIAIAPLSEPNGASVSIGVARLSDMDGAIDSIAMARLSEVVGASVRVLINSLTLKTNTINSENTTTLNTSSCKNEKSAGKGIQESVEQVVVNSLPSAWVLDRILILNRVHPKTQKTVRGASAQALVSWLLYALSPDGHGIDKPMSYALARLKDDPQTGAGDQYDKLANTQPADLIDVAHKASRGSLKTHLAANELDELEDLWIDVMGTNDFAARKLLRYLLGDKSPDIREKITRTESVGWTEEGFGVTIEEKIEEI